MTYYTAGTADMLWCMSVEDLMTNGATQEGRDQRTREHLRVNFELTDPRQRLVLSRPNSPALFIAEVIWILAGGNSVEFLKAWNARADTWSDDGFSNNGAYGARIGCNPDIDREDAMFLRLPNKTKQIGGYDQLLMAYRALKGNENGRQTVIQIWDKTYDFPLDGIPRSKDVPCNTQTYLLIRDGKLHWTQFMRSNDAIWGFPLNVFQWTFLQEVLAGWLELGVGEYHHFSNSYHVYERHWDHVSGVSVANAYEDAKFGTLNHAIYSLSYGDYCAIFPKVVNMAVGISRANDYDSIMFAHDKHLDVPTNWHQLITVLAAERMRRINRPEVANQLIRETSGQYQQSYETYAKTKEK